MYKTVIPFYIICFALYILFSRKPDFQDGEITNGQIHFIKDSNQQNIPKVVFVVGAKKDSAIAAYPLRSLQEDQFVKVIYDTSDQNKAAVYSWWGYWIKWDELIASILIPIIFLFIAKQITASPTPEALMDELEMRNPPKRRKYD